MRDDGYTLLIVLIDGRRLVCSPRADRHFVQARDGSKTEITLQQSVRLFRETREQRVCEYPPEPASSPDLRVPIPISREDLQDAAAWLLLRRRDAEANVSRFGEASDDLIQHRAAQLEEELRQEMYRRDPRDRTFREFTVPYYRSLAQAYRNRSSADKK